MGKIAFVFAGQGAQSVGMGRELYERFACAKRIFDMAGDEVKALSFEGPAEALNMTINAQPCLFAMDMACAAVLRECGVTADGVAGFSLGEIPAITYAGWMDEERALEFVRLRARVMHACATEHPGEMYAVIKCLADEVREICSVLHEAYPVNYNCPGQTVVACAEGTSEGLRTAVAEHGGRAVKLAVSGAFHSPFMDEASERIAAYLNDKELGKMKIPVYSNVTAAVYDDPKELLARQVNSPVLWQKTIENMIADGFDVFIEVGAAQTLSGLIKKINSYVKTLHVCDSESLAHTLQSVSNGGKHA